MAEKLNCIIVEDEIMARRSLIKLCEKSDRLQLIGVFENAEEVLQSNIFEDLELIFLDIELPGKSGLELLENLAIMPQVIFTTANKDYAYDAYEYDVTDFLKKPIIQSRFFKGVEKAIHRQDQLNSIATASARNEIYVRVNGKHIRVSFNSILYFENVGDYVKVITELGNYIIHGSMKSIASRIKHPRFMKVHRSYIVNLDKILDIDNNTLVIEKSVIPISRSHKPLLMKSINVL
jgi:DNA-binding LytR/AlgR family response regulator